MTLRERLESPEAIFDIAHAIRVAVQSAAPMYWADAAKAAITAMLEQAAVNEEEAHKMAQKSFYDSEEETVVYSFKAGFFAALRSFGLITETKA